MCQQRVFNKSTFEKELSGLKKQFPDQLKGINDADVVNCSNADNWWFNKCNN